MKYNEGVMLAGYGEWRDYHGERQKVCISSW